MSDKSSLVTSGVSHITIDSDRAGQRIDNFLISQLKGVPKSRIYRLLRKGEVRVNKGRVQAHYKLHDGDSVRVPPVRVSAEKPKVIPGERLRSLMEESILYQDDSLLVINKPAGLAVHGGSGIDLGAIEVLRQHFSAPRWELVHRLDRDTSGCLLVAKKRSALRVLQQQFREHQTRKNYLCLVAGYWPTRCRQVSLPLAKNQLASGERMVKVSPEGKPSTTQFKILRRYQHATLLEVGLVTGRTHQIRVHTLSQGHPIVGDDKYGDDEINKQFKRLGLSRLFLHAQHLHFDLPNIEPAKAVRKSVEAPLATELQQVLDKLDQQTTNKPSTNKPSANRGN